MNSTQSAPIALLNLVCIISFSGVTTAQDFPSKPIRLHSSGVVGGLTDNTARILAERMQASPEMRGQAVIVENRPGGAGVVSVMSVVKAPPDGYSILIADIGQAAIIPVLDPKPQYDPLRDLTPISRIGEMPFFLSVNTSVGAANLREFISIVKANPGKFSYGSNGSGSVHHLAAESMKTALGLDLLHIPYKGSAQSTPAMIAGQIDVLFTLLAPMSPHVKAGKVNLIAVATAQRSKQAPDIPTFAELGVKDMIIVPTVSALAPAGIPRPLLARLSAEIVKAARHPDALSRFEKLAIDVVANSPDEYAAQVKADLLTFARAVKISGAKPAEF
ncbi:MAG: Bug family tripartite tricarboxylate transporter substrate binding protein [Burkholderiales bacterium]